MIESIPHPALDLATKRDVADVRVELHEMRAEMHALLRAQTWRLTGAIIAGMGAAAAAGRFG